MSNVVSWFILLTILDWTNGNPQTQTEREVATISPCFYIKCGSPYVLNNETCSCECQLECPKGTYLDRVNCQCVKQPPCYPPEPCPYQTNWDRTLCKCVCNEPVHCDPGYELSVDRCECMCYQRICKPGYIFDDLVCDCVPQIDPECPPGFIYDPVECRCICEKHVECRKNFFWDENTCKCICPRAEICKPGFFWNDRECQCVCQLKKDCSQNFYFDPAVCDCVCDPKQINFQCAIGFIFDQSICECVPEVRPSCPEGFVYSEDRCDCVCAQEPNCVNRQMWDENICKCVCPRFRCDAGFYNERVCDCTDKMPPVTDWSTQADPICSLPANGCGSSEKFDEFLCSCVAR